MSLAQDSYPPPPLHTTVPTAMSLNSMLQSGQSFDRYPQLSEDPQPTEQGPQIQLPPQETVAKPQKIETVWEGRWYSLEIMQQPVRARMCGFGDKDRRPITPPPCIKLIVKDSQTMQNIDVSEIDTSYFVLSVDLWSADATKEVNLVRHSATSPSISATTSASYPPNTTPTAAYHQGAAPQYGELYQQSPLSPQNYHQMGMGNVGLPQPVFPNNYGATNAFPRQAELAHYQQVYRQQDLQQQQNLHHHHLPSSQPAASLPATQPMSEQARSYYTAGPPTPSSATTQMGYYQGQGPLLSPDNVPSADPRAQPGGMFTRNLIGSLCVSAFKLADTGNETGVWFVLQDLSVRTEGTFRLKLNFVNVGQTPSSAPATPSSQTFSPNASSGGGGGGGGGGGSTAGGSASAPVSVGKLNTGSAPVLASCFSEPFEVFSAKKFPGVIESTKLSKCFATQGIKIPIRKDGFRGNERNRGDDDDD